MPLWETAYESHGVYYDRAMFIFVSLLVQIHTTFYRWETIYIFLFKKFTVINNFKTGTITCAAKRKMLHCKLFTGGWDISKYKLDELLKVSIQKSNGYQPNWRGQSNSSNRICPQISSPWEPCEVSCGQRQSGLAFILPAFFWEAGHWLLRHD